MSRSGSSGSVRLPRESFDEDRARPKGTRRNNGLHWLSCGSGLVSQAKTASTRVDRLGHDLYGRAAGIGDIHIVLTIGSVPYRETDLRRARTFRARGKV